jgi:hypothetical protein
MGKNELKDILEGLDQRKRSLDALRLLIEAGDQEMALLVASRLRGDLDAIIAELNGAMGRTVPSPDAPPAAAPSADQHPFRTPARGYLGDDEGPGKLERWMESLVRGGWDALAHPRETWRRLLEHRGSILFALAVLLLVFSASRAYNRIFINRYGLIGEYYLDTELKTLYAKRLDHAINFRWLRRPPMRNFRAEEFSIRWTGYVRINEPDIYEFYTISDDGVRLWIGNKMIIDNWNVHGATLDKGEIRLTPGYHKIRLEYYQGSGDMIIKLHWKRPSEPQKRVVPARYLYPEKPQE